MPATRESRRSWRPYEVVQTSPMDCGSAALKCLAEGFGIRVSYGRLREACQTDLDGTSISTLQSVARELGLDAHQELLPADHIGAASDRASAANLPAIIVVRTEVGANHFVVAWRRVGPWLLVMDPASGRRWIRIEEFRRTLYRHSLDASADAWRRFAASDRATALLERRLRDLGATQGARWIQSALADPTWRSLAALDAAARMVHSLTEAGGVARGDEAALLLESLYEAARIGDVTSMSTIPTTYWSVRPHGAISGQPQILNVSGTVLVRVSGRIEAGAAGESAAPRESEPLSREIAAALAEPRARPGLALVAALRAGGLFHPVVLTVFTFVAGALVLGQALLFRALFDLGRDLGLPEQRWATLAALLAFLIASTAIELPISAGVLSIGRQLEARLRILFQTKIPRLAERYFASRPSSDMAERAHSLAILRNLPPLVLRLARAGFQLAFTTIGLVWIDPSAAPLAVVAMLAAVFVPFLFQRAITERELALRNHHGALTRFYLDALLGLVAVRVHGAEANLAREHESILVEWVRAALRLARSTAVVRALVAVTGTGFAITLVATHVARESSPGSALLFGYWALAIPALGEQIARALLELPAVRNATMRAIEPIQALEDGSVAASPGASADLAPVATGFPAAASAMLVRAAGAREAITPSRVARAPLALVRDADTSVPGISIEMRGIAVTVSGHEILSGIDVSIRAGEHVALVGPSGAGKSSWIGLLLGWHRPAHGTLRVDGADFDARGLQALRLATAWVDPGAHLWNRSLFDNLVYGIGATTTGELAQALEQAELQDLLQSLPEGLRSALGEGGGFLSGGEGQRVRFARAWLRPNVRLALLDEPFRGLDRERRAALLARAREHWRGATLVCATHDLAETAAFDRVLVVEGGRIVEDGAPRDLVADPSSRYAALLAAEASLHAEVWSHESWTRWHVVGGRVQVVAPGRSAT